MRHGRSKQKEVLQQNINGKGERGRRRDFLIYKTKCLTSCSRCTQQHGSCHLRPSPATSRRAPPNRRKKKKEARERVKAQCLAGRKGKGSGALRISAGWRGRRGVPRRPAAGHQPPFPGWRGRLPGVGTPFPCLRREGFGRETPIGGGNGEG